MTNTWKCNEASYVPGYGIVKAGDTVVFGEGSEPDIVKTCFECLTPKQKQEILAAKESESDMTYRAKIERLKDMKVKLPRGCSKAEIEKLFAEHISKVELPAIV